MYAPKRVIPTVKYSTELVKLFQEIYHRLGELRYDSRKLSGYELSEKELEHRARIFIGMRTARRHLMPEIDNLKQILTEVDQINFHEVKAFEEIHKQLYRGNDSVESKYRDTFVTKGIYPSSKSSLDFHSPARDILKYLAELISYLKETDHCPITKACLAHVAIVRIWPFQSGSQIMAWIWFDGLIREVSPVMRGLPNATQYNYMHVSYFISLKLSLIGATVNPFLLYVLKNLLMDLTNFRETSWVRTDKLKRITFFSGTIKSSLFRRVDYQRVFPTISKALASKDIKWAVDQGIVISIGSNRWIRYKINPRKIGILGKAGLASKGSK